MQQSKVQRVIVAIIGYVFAVILVLLPVHAFLSTWLGSVFGNMLIWKSWKEIAIAALVPLVVWLCVLRPDIARAMWRSRLNRVIAAYVVLTIIMAVFSAASSEAVIAGLLMNLRFFAMFVLAQLLVVINPHWLPRAKQWIAPWLLGTAAVLSVLAILQVTVIPRDFLTNFGYDKDTTIAPFMTVDQNPNALRAFATMRGPNTLAAYLILPLALALYIWVHDRRKWWALAISGLIVLALALTQSRGGWLGALAMLAVLAWVSLPRQKLLRWLKIGAVPFVLAVAAGLWLATTVPAIRLVVFHSGGNTQNESLIEGSSELHVQYVMDGIVSVAQHPLGQGVGTAGPASYYNKNAPPVVSEDYYVQIAEEVGLLGLALFTIICVMTARACLRQRDQQWARVLFASFIGITLINVFMHGWADDPLAMTWWAIAGLFIAAPPTKTYN